MPQDQLQLLINQAPPQYSRRRAHLPNPDMLPFLSNLLLGFTVFSNLYERQAGKFLYRINWRMLLPRLSLLSVSSLVVAGICIIPNFQGFFFGLAFADQLCDALSKWNILGDGRLAFLADKTVQQEYAYTTAGLNMMVNIPINMVSLLRLLGWASTLYFYSQLPVVKRVQREHLYEISRPKRILKQVVYPVRRLGELLYGKLGTYDLFRDESHQELARLRQQGVSVPAEPKGWGYYLYQVHLHSTAYLTGTGMTAVSRFRNLVMFGLACVGALAPWQMVADAHEGKTPPDGWAWLWNMAAAWTVMQISYVSVTVAQNFRALYERFTPKDQVRSIAANQVLRGLNDFLIYGEQQDVNLEPLSLTDDQIQYLEVGGKWYNSFKHRDAAGESVTGFNSFLRKCLIGALAFPAFYAVAWGGATYKSLLKMTSSVLGASLLAYSLSATLKCLFLANPIRTFFLWAYTRFKQRGMNARIADVETQVPNLSIHQQAIAFHLQLKQHFADYLKTFEPSKVYRYFFKGIGTMLMLMSLTGAAENPLLYVFNGSNPNNITGINLLLSALLTLAAVFRVNYDDLYKMVVKFRRSWLERQELHRLNKNIEQVMQPYLQFNEAGEQLPLNEDAVKAIAVNKEARLLAFLLLKRLSKAPDHLTQNFFLHVENAPEGSHLSVSVNEGDVAVYNITVPTDWRDYLRNRRSRDQSAVKRIAVVPHHCLPIHDHNAPVVPHNTSDDRGSEPVRLLGADGLFAQANTLVQTQNDRSRTGDGMASVAQPRTLSVWLG